MSCLLTTEWTIGPLRGRPSGILPAGHVVHRHIIDVGPGLAVALLVTLVVALLCATRPRR
jgi:hypothetical protein